MLLGPSRPVCKRPPAGLTQWHTLSGRGARVSVRKLVPEPREWTRRPTLHRGVGGRDGRLPVRRVCPCVGTGSREGRGMSPSAPRPPDMLTARLLRIPEWCESLANVH